MRLETERLVLRPWEKSDAEALYEIAKDPRVGPAAGWKPHQNLAESYRVIGDVLIAPENYAIILKATGELLGSMGLRVPGDSNLPLQKGEAELGGWLGVPYWGQEYALEAARAIVQHGFDELGLSRIYGCSFTDNEKSDRLQAKLGFRYRRTEEHHYCPQLDVYRPVNVRVLVNPELEI